MRSIAFASISLKQNNHEWKIVIPQHLETFFLEEATQLGKTLERLENLIKEESLDEFRFDLEISSLLFSSLVRGNHHELHLFSRELNQELALVKAYTLDGKEEEISELVAMVERYIATSPFKTPSTALQKTYEYDLAKLWEDDYADVKERTHEIIEKLVSKVSEYKPSLFEKISDFGLDLTARFSLFRVHVLKFLAILPSLDHDKSGTEVKKSLIEAISRLIHDSETASKRELKGQNQALPKSYILWAKFILSFSKIVPARLLSFIVRKKVELMATRFIAGSSIKKASKALKGLGDTNRQATLDQLGELVVSKEEADLYLSRVLEIIEGLKEHIKVGDKNASGVYKAHVSIKVSALSHDFRAYAFDYSYQLVAPRLKKILLKAKEEKVFINIDAEHYHFRDIVLKIYEKVLLETDELKDYDQTGIVLQAYLKDAYEHLMDISELANKRKLSMPIRLVKGAYWDAETVEAEAHNFSSFQFLNKEETDIHYRQMIVEILKLPHLKLAVASHNIQDHSFAEAVRELRYKDSSVIEHQCLHMTYEALSMGLAKMGWPVRNYIPIGNLLVGMAYLVRRIMENSSQVGILTIMRSHQKALMMKSPYDVHFENIKNKTLALEGGVKHVDSRFKNIFPMKPYKKDHLLRFEKSCELLKSKLPLNFGDKSVIFSSHDLNLKIGSVSCDDAKEVDSKIQKLFSGFHTSLWKSDICFRTKTLFKLADLLLINRDYLSSLIIYESGKTITEAYADVDEAIDFVNFYTREALSLHYDHTPKGVMGVIAPWNFPLAILCGMTTASLAVGNACIVKPAEQTPLIAEEFIRLCYEAGIPEVILQLSQGDHIAGKAIVSHKLISGIVFTGSKAVGLDIYKKLVGQYIDESYENSDIPKTVITEMGGKNAIIITNNCEMDETVAGVLYSAFGHAGQKCSAASRVIIHEEIKDVFIERFKNAAMDLKVGKSTALETYLNPIITLEDAKRIRETVKEAIDEAKKFNGKLILDRSQEFDTNIVGPVIIELPKERALHKESWAQKEIFGPVIHVVSYKDFNEAIELFNSTEYALTGGVFAQSQDDIDELIEKMEVGNIYVNRANTGARVAIEPFGGFKLSGTGPKAGGVDYLKAFVFHNKEQEFYYDHKVRLTSAYQNKKYQLTPSFLSFDKRKVILLNALDLIERHLEEITLETSEMIKMSLQSFRSDFISFSRDIVLERLNRVIPGQLSYNKQDIGIGVGLFIISSTGLNFKTLEDLFLALLLKNGVEIITLNEDADRIWKILNRYIHEAGFSEYNLSMREYSLEGLKNIELEATNFLYLENSPTQNELILSSFSWDKLNSTLTRQIIQRPNEKLYVRGLDFCHVRSFAINVMRHGAPMELDL